VFPYAAVVPGYHKIRLRFTDVVEWLMAMDGVFSNVLPEGSEREWDVRLILSSCCKEPVHAASGILVAAVLRNRANASDH
jgi:hypothetical protein